MNGKPWTQEDLNKLIELYPKATWEELKLAFPDRTLSSLDHKAKRLHIQRQVPLWWAQRTLGLSATEAAYLAGFTDGDGSIGIAQDRRGVFCPHIHWGNTSKESQIWLRQLLGEKTVYAYRTHQSPKNHRPVYRVAIRQRRAIRTVLQQMLPYLRIRRNQAKLMLQFFKIEEEIAFNFKRKERPQVVRTNTELQAVFNSLRELNKKGPQSSPREWSEENNLR